jgi:Short C-terminal domain
VGDMFNNGLKARVDALCNELAGHLQSDDMLKRAPAASQSQSQSGGASGVSLFVSGKQSSGSWWPEKLGPPASVGAQNNLRYAYFPATRRLAIDMGGTLSVYDTGDHQISGVSQQQSGDQSLTFTSQHGLVRVADLPRVDENRQAAPHAAQPEAPTAARNSETRGAQAAASPAPEGDVFATLERLAALQQKGILSQSEYEAKKAELLARI